MDAVHCFCAQHDVLLKDQDTLALPSQQKRDTTAAQCSFPLSWWRQHTAHASLFSLLELTQRWGSLAGGGGQHESHSPFQVLTICGLPGAILLTPSKPFAIPEVEPVMPAACSRCSLSVRTRFLGVSVSSCQNIREQLLAVRRMNSSRPCSGKTRGEDHGSGLPSFCRVPSHPSQPPSASHLLSLESLLRCQPLCDAVIDRTERDATGGCDMREALSRCDYLEALHGN
jgi:hypothetical protein